MTETEKNEQNITTLIPAKTVAKRLSTSVRTVWRYKSAGRLPETVTIGGSIRWIDSEISAWISAGAPDRKTWNLMKGGNC